MEHSLVFIRTLFLALCALFSIVYVTSNTTVETSALNIFIGLGIGLTFGTIVILFDQYLRRFDLRSFVLASIGLGLGCLFGDSILFLVRTALPVAQLSSTSYALLSVAICLCAAYVGMTATFQTYNLFSHLFIRDQKLSNVEPNNRFLIETSLLLDPRLFDLASSGILDQKLAIPQFSIKEQQDLLENSDENIRNRARRCLEMLKKLEALPHLQLKVIAQEAPESKDAFHKLVYLARQMEMGIFIADMPKLPNCPAEDIRFLNLMTLSNALKPLTQSGEFINIKIQRYGKEPRQGVGYLEDGTMVVVNGGAEFIGETIRAQLLSIKHTSSGRMIFCNALEETLSLESYHAPTTEYENSAKNYFAL